MQNQTLDSPIRILLPKTINTEDYMPQPDSIEEQDDEELSENQTSDDDYFM